ncbi:MAG: hypothetical protein JWN06_2308 [Propionibacteriaceae bacterium]|jgi:uncharacterized protein YcnI|nr:hypothetical protein [Propionibacteriaceae bacterium]
MSSQRRITYSNRARCRSVAVGVLAAGLVSLTTGVAQAHVRVLPDSTEPGSFSQLTFRVPNESSTAGTVKVAVQLPQDKPFLNVSAKPVPGWKVNIQEAPLPKPVEFEGTTITKAARTVTWAAASGIQIAPKQYQEFAISVGPLPESGKLQLPATQTYSDDTVVNWDEPTPASGEEPEHPAPELEVGAVATEHGHSANPSEAPASPAADTAPATAASQSDTTARWLGGAALLAALVAVALAVTGRRRGANS